MMIERLLDHDLLPDPVIRAGIRQVVAARLREQEAGSVDEQRARFTELLESFRLTPIAVAPEAANAQHYELPPSFFARLLGPHLKYSCAWWPPGVTTLAEAERQMLDLTTARAAVEDGQRVLDLGCGWGSLTLYLAQRFHRSQIVAVSNSERQREYILGQAATRRLTNVTVVTADINRFAPTGRFDRIVSVEMLEHVRNHRALFARLARWLADEGRFFAHVFAHRRFAYPFDARDSTDWMARHFFTGGMMPSDDLFVHLQDDLQIEEHWRLNGGHYRRTAEAWLHNMDRHRMALDTILADAYGPGNVTRWRCRWRVFLMACAEMFGYRNGEEWIVSHYRFKKRGW